MTYVCTEKATINEWLKEIEHLKKENAFQRTIIDNITEEHKGLAKENMELIKKVKLLEQDRDMYREKYKNLLLKNK